MKIEITDKEASVLITLLDEVTKAKGLSVAQSTLYFLDKIQKAIKEPKEEDTYGYELMNKETPDD